jgi:hypothetical protein
MYCILKIENHPDRIIEEIIGPFADYDKARQLSVELEHDPWNFNGDHRLHNFYVREMEMPVRSTDS